MSRIGITTTVPIEVILAAGHTPVDLNNLFVNDPDPSRLLARAERHGFPLNCCTWIKGIFAAALEYGIDQVITVVSGDCSNTLMLKEVWEATGVKTIPLAYPQEPNEEAMAGVVNDFAVRLGTTPAAAEEMRGQLADIRALAAEFDMLTYKVNVITGAENHYWLVSSSDFNQNWRKFTIELQSVITEAGKRQPFKDRLRLGFIGVPSVFAADFYAFTERFGGRVVFNETQRQFAMTSPADSLEQAYTKFTYPYSLGYRLADIKEEIMRREIDGVIHYVQAFCHRSIGDIIVKRELNVPVLALEGGSSIKLTQHQKTRIEAFLDVVEFRKARLI